MDSPKDIDPQSDPPHRRLPPELCDSIIDVFAPPPVDISYTADGSENDRIRATRTFTLVCRDWLPRARRHFYHTVWISDGPSLLKLCATLSACKQLIPLITRIVAARGPGTSLSLPAQGYFPFHAFFARRPPIVSVVLSDFWWDESEYPTKYRAMIVPYNMAIVRLQLTGVIFPSLHEMFHLIRRFTYLVHLSIISAVFEEQPSELESMRMQALHPCWAAASLRTLEVGAPGPGRGAIPGVDLLGDRIEHFRAVLAIKDSSTPVLSHYPHCVSTYASLRTLRITLQPALSFTDPSPGSPDEGARVWGPIHDTLLNFISAVRSPLDTLRIALLAQRRDQEFVKDAAKQEDEDVEDEQLRELPYRYRTSRSNILDILLAPDIRDILLTAPFTHLTSLQFVIRDNLQKASPESWTSSIRQRIPGLSPGIIRADVEHCTGTVYDLLWEEDVPSVQPSSEVLEDVAGHE